MKTSKLGNMMSGGAAAAMVLGAALVGAPAQAQSLIPGVTGCGAAGVKQERGALIGALAGGLLGNSVSGRNRTTGTVVGAAVGAAAGSAVGCKMQHGDERKAAYGGVYNRGGYRLSSAIAPASYQKLNDTMVATSTVNLRSAPTTRSGRVGQLRAGERFQALAEVAGTEWILVGQGGVGVGYVHGDFARPLGERYAYGY
jgi:uncharacterized protein YgiM (DUF1202 family)